MTAPAFLHNSGMAEVYRAPKWLPGGNAQTIYPYFINLNSLIGYRRERWEMDDGDFVDIDWLEGAPDKPLVILLHGLEGSSQSHYALSLMRFLQKLHWRGAVVHFRGCSGYPNRLPRAYHAGDSAEVDRMLRYIVHQNDLQEQDSACYVVGVSLGGNALLKWLGEQGTQAATLIAGVVAVSVPLDLAAAGEVLDSGFNRVYTHHFLTTLKHKALKKNKQFPGLLDARAVAACRSLYEFDNLVTAPLHGFRDTDDYWYQSSSKPWLGSVQVPTLLINARNDPFLPESVLPQKSEVSSLVSLEYPQEGGHVGFMQGTFPGSLDWLPQRIVSFFSSLCDSAVIRV
ncbi:alpha/beta fold hydrolase [Nitrosomonas sp.]|uniref:YheT family hydrolase n=1 Tax=Nitrosomonas sp. TaxID=42353 RepID=UPI0025F5CE32|nr:alpha/beta fold hydrolase [Nitrosomonas sp.]MCC6916773.1 alpha/beta fold hydrolase [Nitrosomonas sp.]